MARRIKLVKADAQGSWPWLHPDWGYKQCANLGPHRAWREPGGTIVCPGCSRVCLMPDGWEVGQEFLSVARPKE